MANLKQEAQRLSQDSDLENFRRDFSPLEMLPVYLDSGYRGLICSSLVPRNKKEEALNRFSADQSWPGPIGMFGFYSVIDGVEPIVLPREFHGVRPSYPEICEEFRLFHNLFHDRTSDTYLKFDDAGDETEVAVVSDNGVEIRLIEIREFLAEKEMCLCLQFDLSVWSGSSLAELGMSETVDHRSEELVRWMLAVSGKSSGTSGHRASSLLRGIRLIEPFPRRDTEAEYENRKYQDFIIGVDDAGDEITRSCDPATIYQENGIAGYLTSVVFNRSVLDKYISQPSKYSVDAFSVSCANLWYLRLDNDRDAGNVIVHLGDLAKLPSYQEQMHWRSHNIASDGGLSETAFRNRVMAEPANPGRTEYVFQASYSMLRSLSKKYLGWHLLMPLHEDDQYRLSDVRVPAYGEQKAFDDFVGNLHNVLVDSLNSRQLANLVPVSVRQRKRLNGKSISLLEEVLQGGHLKGEEHIAFLRNLNDLRNKVDGHRKGKGYSEALEKFDTEGEDLRFVCERILGKSVKFLDFLCKAVPFFDLSGSERQA